MTQTVSTPWTLIHEGKIIPQVSESVTQPLYEDRHADSVIKLRNVKEH